MRNMTFISRWSKIIRDLLPGVSLCHILAVFCWHYIPPVTVFMSLVSYAGRRMLSLLSIRWFDLFSRKLITLQHRIANIHYFTVYVAYSEISFQSFYVSQKKKRNAWNQNNVPHMTLAAALIMSTVHMEATKWEGGERSTKKKKENLAAELAFVSCSF